jgi:hypothetical protein
MNQTKISNCQNCGSALTPADFQQPACRFCGAAFQHHVQAANKVLELNAMMQSTNGTGMPDGLAAALGRLPQGPSPPGPYGGPPAGGYGAPAPMGFPPVPMMPPRRSSNGAVWVLLIIALVLVLGMMGAGAGFFFVMRHG